MTIKRTPGLIYSPLCRKEKVGGVTVEVVIVRIDDEPGWFLEVVHENGESNMIDDEFETDAEADFAFKRKIAREGIIAFVKDDHKANVIRFPFDRRR